MRVSPPMSDDQPLMRYLTHDKFVRLLDPAPAFESWSFLDPAPKGRFVRYPSPSLGVLWMSLPHKFRDQDEGTFPALNADDESYCDCMARHLGLSPEEAERKKRDFLARNPAQFRSTVRSMALLCGVSCWYQDSNESMKMWNEYVPESRGVIVKTMLKKFDDALGHTTPNIYNRKAKPLFATIDYVDRDNYFLVDDGYYGLLSIKGEEFKHEREVRLIAKSPGLVQATIKNSSTSSSEIEELVENAPGGFNLLLDLQHLILEIRVHPSSGDDYLEEIKQLVASKVLSPEIVKGSDLAPE